MSCLDLNNGRLELPLSHNEGGNFIWDVRLDSGLYQFSVIADGKDFPWESLYYEMKEFGNQGARTGPWDFKPLVGSPLVPSFWVYVNDEKLGLWPFQRISIEDIEARVFRGRMAFRVMQSGPVRISLVPFIPHGTRWLSCVLEIDPVDKLECLAISASAAAQKLSLPRWRRDDFWESKRKLLQATESKLAPILKSAVEWVLRPGKLFQDEEGRWKNNEESGPQDMTVCVAAWRLFGNEQARDMGLKLAEEQINLPGWGRPREDMYGWDGDLVAIDPMRACITAYFGLADCMSDELRGRLREKIRYQGNRFVTMALLMRDYWGGSVLQDHGWRALLGFPECAINMLGELEEASAWLEFLVPRFRRALDAMPLDGHLPASSYGSPALYVTALARLRQAWLEASGEDIYDEAPVKEIFDHFATYIYKPEAESLLVSTNLFLTQMAEKYQSAEALYWLEKCHFIDEERARQSNSSLRWHAQGLFEGFLNRPDRLPLAVKAPRARAFTFFEDAGMVIYRQSAENGLHLQFQCGPWLGYNAYFKSDNPCDRMCVTPGPGHFTLGVGRDNIVVRPDSNYALRSSAHNCLLIDGCGQVGGDIDYPMSLPSWRWLGEQISTVRYDEKTGHLFCRLNLQPLYAERLGVLYYTRDFIVTGPGELICRDEILLRNPLRLTWLFHGTEKLGMTLVSKGLIRYGSVLDLQLKSSTAPLEEKVEPTSVVFSYTGSGLKFLHAKYETMAPTDRMVTEFAFRTQSASTST